MSETIKHCPKCKALCDRHAVDIGVGTQYGPWGCTECAWSEDDQYDLSEGQNPVDEEGGAKDQYGMHHPPGSSMARAYRLAEGLEQLPKFRVKRIKK